MAKKRIKKADKKVSCTYSLSPKEIKTIEENAKKGNYLNPSRYIASRCVYHTEQD